MRINEKFEKREKKDVFMKHCAARLNMDNCLENKKTNGLERSKANLEAIEKDLKEFE